MKLKGYVLDTHVLIWAFSKPDKLNKIVHDLLSNDNASYTIIIPVIVLVELKFLIQKGRLNLDYKSILKELEAKSYIEIAQFDDYMLEFIHPQLNIHDSMIVATSLFYKDFIGFDIDLITKDKEIIDSNIVNTIW